MIILRSVNSVVNTTDVDTLDEGSILDATNAMSVSYTVLNSGDESLDYTVVAGNASDLSDAVVVQNSATLASGACGTYALTISPYCFYGIFLISTVEETPSEATIKGRTKG